MSVPVCFFSLWALCFPHLNQAQDTGSSGLQEMKALASAFSNRISKVQLLNDDWAVEIDGTWYYWARGRFLTVNQRENWEEYVGIRFYNYELGPLRERIINTETAERLREYTKARNNDTRLRFNGFPDALYNVHSKKEADAFMEEVAFFGLRTRIHPFLVSPLARIEAQIEREAARDSSVRAFLNSLQNIHGYNWRNIAGTTRRSYHSYGMAVDLAQGSYKHWAYWQWAASGGVTEWWNIPIVERHHVPQAVIDAFETEGFVWGGKWLLFDNIHFEYRPEVIILADRNAN